jgi:NAD-dependent SIR2 family protein deacetylase
LDISSIGRCGLAERFQGELIEVNPEETPLSRFATHLVREPAAIALPRLVDELAN